MADGSATGAPSERPGVPGPGLKLTVHDGVQLLDNQRGVHPRRSVPEALQDLVFPPDEADTVLYAILDAGKVENLRIMLEDAVIPHRCLFKGDAEEEYGDVGPWLVVLSEVDTLTRMLFTHLEGEDTPWNIARFEPGILFRASPDFDAVWRHWRRFYRMKYETGKTYYFRFWEPAPMAAYLGYIKDDAERVAHWFCREGARISRMFLLESRPAHWRLTEIEAEPENYTRPRSQDGKPFMLTSGEVGAIARARLERDMEEVARRIEKTFGEHLDEDRPDDLVYRRVRGLFDRMMPAGIKQLDHLYLLACWEVFYGPGFERKDPEDQLRQICLSQAREARKVEALRDRMNAIPPTILAAEEHRQRAGRMTRAFAIFRIAVLGMALSGGAFAMGMFGQSRPTEVTFNDASHQSTPIMVDGLTINGQSMGAFPILASSNWMNPRGGSPTLTGLPWDSADDQIVDIHAQWTEIETGRAYAADVSVPWGDLHIEDVVGVTAYMTFVYGRNGEFLLFTNADADPKTGQFNGREVMRICGERTPGRDQNYGLRVNEIPGLGRLIDRRAQWMAVPDVESSCSGEAG